MIGVPIALEEDKIVENCKLDFKAGNVNIVPVDEVFLEEKMRMIKVFTLWVGPA